MIQPKLIHQKVNHIPPFFLLFFLQNDDLEGLGGVPDRWV